MTLAMFFLILALVLFLLAGLFSCFPNPPVSRVDLIAFGLAAMVASELFGGGRVRTVAQIFVMPPEAPAQVAYQ